MIEIGLPAWPVLTGWRAKLRYAPLPAILFRGGYQRETGEKMLIFLSLLSRNSFLSANP